MGTLFVYIQPFSFDQNIEKTERIFSFSYPLFIFVYFSIRADDSLS